MSRVEPLSIMRAGGDLGRVGFDPELMVSLAPQLDALRDGTGDETV
jgi:hypothetical protein